MPVLLLIALVVGAIGLFLALPGGRQTAGGVGWLLLAAAGGVLVAFLLRVGLQSAALGWFTGCAVVGLFAALRVITHKKPVYSALYFVLLVVAVTGMLLVAGAEFLSAALVIVYAGAILVTYVFVIMLAQQARPALYDAKAREPLWASGAGFLLVATLTSRLFENNEAPLEVAGTFVREAAGSPEVVGTSLLTEYILAIQIAGVLLLAAMVGAIAIARRKQTPAELEGGESD